MSNLDKRISLAELYLRKRGRKLAGLDVGVMPVIRRKCVTCADFFEIKVEDNPQKRLCETCENATTDIDEEFETQEYEEEIVDQQGYESDVCEEYPELYHRCDYCNNWIDIGGGDAYIQRWFNGDCDYLCYRKDCRARREQREHGEFCDRFY